MLCQIQLKTAKNELYASLSLLCKENINEKWKFMKSLINNDLQGHQITDPTQICSIFNNYFINVGENRTKDLEIVVFKISSLRIHETVQRS